MEKYLPLQQQLLLVMRFGLPMFRPMGHCRLELLEFKGSLVNNNGLLQWKTENETNTSVFVLERSTDANNYHPIGTILAANTSGIHHYTSYRSQYYFSWRYGCLLPAKASRHGRKI